MPSDQTSDLIVYGAPWMRSGCRQLWIHEGQLTLMYVLVPTNVLAIELISSPDTPKSQILISPFELAKILDGLMSGVREALGSLSSYAPRWIMRCTS